MTDDLVKRLRQLGDKTGLMYVDYDTTIEAADCIEKLVAVLRTYACNCGLERDWLCEDREASSECGWRANKALEELK